MIKGIQFSDWIGERQKEENLIRRCCSTNGTFFGLFSLSSLLATVSGGGRRDGGAGGGGGCGQSAIQTALLLLFLCGIFGSPLLFLCPFSSSIFLGLFFWGNQSGDVGQEIKWLSIT